MTREYDPWRSARIVVDLSGLVDADGLTPEQRQWASMLVDEYGRHASHNEKLLRYYEGNVAVSDYGVKADIENDQTCHWPQKAVDALTERIRLERFTFGETPESDVLARIERENNLINNYNRHVSAKLLYGCMAATVTRGEVGTRVRFHSAETFTAIPSPDFEDGVVAAGLALARRERAPWNPREVVATVVNMHLPNNVVELRQVEAGKWVAIQGPTPEREPSLYVFAHNGSGTLAPFGQTRITKFVRTLTDDAIRCMWHMQVSGAFYSMPKLAMLDLTPEQYDAVVGDKLRWQLDRVIVTEADESGDSKTNVLQFNGNSPQPFVDELRALACQFSGATGVPLNSLGIVQDNPSSAEAIQAAREDICLVAERDIAADKATLRKVALAAMAVEENTSIAGLGDAERSVMAEFESPMLYSMSSRADWATKVNSMVDGFGETSVGLEMSGLSDGQIRRVSGELKQQKGMRLATATMETRALQLSARQTGDTA